MANKYIVVDVEASGPIPEKYDMLSFGACIAGESDKQFYRELKPTSKNYDIDAMRVGSKGLKCLDDVKNWGKYNPKSNLFEPKAVLDVLTEKGESPKEAMNDFSNWIITNSQENRPIFLSENLVFDGMFIFYYFHKFTGKNPFGHSGEDIGSIYKGIKENIYASLRNVKIDENLFHTHNALDDAVLKTKKSEKILGMLKYGK